VGVGVLRAASALALLVTSAIGFLQSVLTGSLAARVVDLLDQILLVFMIVEILYTVQISFREHALIPEPFLIVGLIAAIRRVLVLTAAT
jgi:phosphate starvation-inducible membrane PsiE